MAGVRLLKYFAIAAAIQLVWGFTPSASRLILDHLPVEGYAAIRYTVSGLIFIAYTLWRHKRLRVAARDMPAMLLLGILTYAVNSLGTLYGLQVGGVLNFALASSFNAIITAAIAALVLRETLTRRFAAAAALSVVGGVCLFFGKFEVSTFDVAATSLLLVWGAYVCEALGFAYSKNYRERMPLSEYIGVLQLAGAAAMWVYAGATDRMPTAVFSMPGSAWAALVFVCLVACSLCYFVMYWLLNHMEGHKLAFFDCFHTLAAAAFGAWLFSEPFNTKMLVGGGLMLGAVLIITGTKLAKGESQQRGGSSHDQSVAAARQAHDTP
jgi:drug/metabolite transporter (DMT)-like permease